MAELVFLFRGHLRKRHAQWGIEQYGVKAKAALALALGRDLNRHPAYGDQRLGVLRMAHAHQGADHGPLAIGGAGLLGQLLQHGLHIVGIAFFVAKLGAVIGRLHPRQATKGIQAQTRIVGNGGQPRFFGSKTGFGQGIFDKSAVRLWRFASKQIALGNQLHPQGGQDRLQFCELATVIGR